MNNLFIVSSHGLGETTMAANRLRQLVQFLLGQGHRIHVVCPRLGTESIPSHPQLRVHHFEFITNRTDFRSKLGRKLLFPCLGVWVGWKVAKSVKELHVISSIPEVEAWAIGFGVKLLSPRKVRLTVEVRDPFSVNSLYPWGYWKRLFYRSLERVLLGPTDQLIFLTSRIQDLYQKTFPRSRSVQDHTVVITNGFEPDNYRPTSRQKKDRILITHIGSFYGDRNPLLFLRILDDFLKSSEETNAFEIRFIGTVHGETLSKSIHAASMSPSLRSIIHWVDQVSHAYALEAMQDSDINLLITHTTGSDYAIPGKFFEYLGANRPILALTSDPLVVKLMAQLNAGWVCSRPEDLLVWFRNNLNNVAALRSRTQDPVRLEPFYLSNIHQRWSEYVLAQPEGLK